MCISRTVLSALPEHLAFWTGRFVRVYERPRSGFQFSPIISNGWVSWQDHSGHYSFYHFLLPPTILSLSLSLFVFPCFYPLLLFRARFFRSPDCRWSFFKARRGRTYQARRLSGITDYVLQVLPERKRCPGRKRSPRGRRYAGRGGRDGRGDSISGIYGAAAVPRARMHACGSAPMSVSR